MVQMECNYVSPAFFRELEKEYQSEAAVGAEDGGAEGDVDPEDRMAQLARGAPHSLALTCLPLT
jgi:hypothetical protein